MPTESKILCAQAQGDDLVLWAEVKPLLEVYDSRIIVIVGTGYTLPEGKLEYISTAQMGHYVWHIYERITNEDT